MSEQFGKLTADQLRQIISILPGLATLRAELETELVQHPDRLARLAPDTLNWAWAYELPFTEHLARLVFVMGGGPQLVAAAASDDPHQVLLDSVDEEPPEWTGGPGGQYKLQDVFVLLQGAINSFDCLMIYGAYLNDYIALARNGGKEGEDALFKAIRVDPTVVSTPTAVDCLSRALLVRDEAFLKGWRAAVLGRTGKQATYLKHFRFVMQALYEVGALNLPNTKLVELVFDLGLYENAAGAAKNVRELVRKAKKDRAISN